MRISCVVWIFTTFYACCKGQLSIRDEVLKQKTEWIEPGRDRLFKSEQVDTISTGPYKNCPEIGELENTLRKAEKHVSQCEAKLVSLQLAADLSDNGKLDMNLVYIKKLVAAILNRVEIRSEANKDRTVQLQLSLNKRLREEIAESMRNLDQKSVAQLVDRVQSIINQARITYDNTEKRSNFSQLYLDLSAILAETDVFTAIQVSIAVFAVIFVFIAVKCRSKWVTFSYLLVFAIWISYFWHWKNMLRKSQAKRHFLSQKNPCESSRSFFNPLRYFDTTSKECEEYLKKMFTPMFWEFTPIEVLCDMVATYTSNIVSVLVGNIMSSIGDAVRDFADKQSWFSAIPAFSILLLLLFLVFFKLSGFAVSLFYGALQLKPIKHDLVETPQVKLTQAALINPISRTEKNSNGMLITRRWKSFSELNSYEQVPIAER